MSATEAPRTTDHDSPWKIALEGYFQELALLFPAVHAELNWSQGYNCQRPAITLRE